MSDAAPDPAAMTEAERRHEAVRLRLAGRPLKEITARTGLSAPTIAAAHKRFLAGGWAQVNGRPRGRQPGEGRHIGGNGEQQVHTHLTAQAPDAFGLPHRLWSTAAVSDLLLHAGLQALSSRTLANYLARWHLTAPRPATRLAGGGEARDRWARTVYPSLLSRAEQEGATVFWVDERQLPPLDGGPADAGPRVLRAVTLRGKLYWLGHGRALQVRVLTDFFDRLLHTCEGKAFVILDGMHWARAATLSTWLARQGERLRVFHPPDPASPRADAEPKRGTAVAGRAAGDAPVRSADAFAQQMLELAGASSAGGTPMTAATDDLRHLARLEAESLHIFREIVAECERPVMLYSGGKDSAVMLHLARKAFYPSPPPFPLLHIDTTWKFRELYAYRDRIALESGMRLIVHVNAEGLAKGINPFTHGSSIHTDIMKTEALKQALTLHRFDAAFGGGRRDEERSRSKERICSLRSPTHRWDPRHQRPEPWQLLNTRLHRGESLRVFPLSNWTELDVWRYIAQQQLSVVPLYFALPRPVVERDGALIMVDDARLPLRHGEVPVLRRVRFRTLGCYPLTAAVPSQADTVQAVIAEMLTSRETERHGRLIDHDSTASMEKKKQEGYF